MIRKHIHFIKMGGTIEFIDPAYDAINKNLMKLDTTIDSYLESIVKPHFTFSTESIVEKDSRDITDEDRTALANAIMSSKHETVIVTHGTFTMTDTALFLDNMKLDGKKVILTGSMIPVIGFAASDAGFNLGFAIASFDNVDVGVYVSMNGGIFKANEVTKNTEDLRFE
ncbi:MAG: asparaginase domain-containing protein [Candidatus Saccharibacteria bacterium]|nr:asparaginase domain-containing protein [Candidatus Saccharibacteria bacterium]